MFTLCSHNVADYEEVGVCFLSHTRQLCLSTNRPGVQELDQVSRSLDQWRPMVSSVMVMFWWRQSPEFLTNCVTVTSDPELNFSLHTFLQSDQDVRHFQCLHTQLKSARCVCVADEAAPPGGSDFTVTLMSSLVGPSGLSLCSDGT